MRQRKLCNRAEGNVYGTFSENGYIRVPEEGIYTTFAYWQKRLRKDLTGAEVHFAWELSPDDTILTFTREDGKQKLLTLEKAGEEFAGLLRWLKEN